jgi:DNA-binding transcriptional LysR family regulator
MNISTFDLNLLRVLDALLRERNVSRAAERLALSQPAVSNALSRLRELLDDPLLVRVGRVMQPTPRALSLEAPIRAALQQIHSSLNAGQSFDPARSQQRFTIAVTDYVELLCMPGLLQRLSQRAPGIHIAIRQLTPTLPAEAMDKGEIDLALGRFLSLPERFQRRHWAEETLQLVARKDHPQLREPLDVAGFLALRHLWVHGGQTRGMVDQWLDQQGLQRQIVYTTPNYLQAAHVVAASDLAVVLPFTLEPFQLDIVTLAQRERDTALQWLIAQVIAVGQQPR